MAYSIGGVRIQIQAADLKKGAQGLEAKLSAGAPGLHTRHCTGKAQTDQRAVKTHMLTCVLHMAGGPGI